MQDKTTFNKIPFSIENQILLLEKRGLCIDDESKAKAFLQQVIYYRFSGYALHFELFHNRKRTHKFKPNSSFSDVIKLYEFDTKLRQLLFKYVELIETAFRSIFCTKMSLKYEDSHWYLNDTLFKKKFDHRRFLQECEREVNRSREVFIKSYNENYNYPKLPASWMIIEILSLGKISSLYSMLNDRENIKLVSDHFNCSPQEMPVWMHSICVLRNACAHHSRIWNKSSHIAPRLSHKRRPQWLNVEKKRISSLFVVIYKLLGSLNKEELFNSDFLSLLNEYPEIEIDKMGFPSNWDKTL